MAEEGYLGIRPDSLLKPYSALRPFDGRSDSIPEIRLVAAKCPSCGATLEVPGNLNTAHCVYCGAKVIVSRSSGKVVCRICGGHGKVDVCKACGGTGKCSWTMHWSALGRESGLSIGSAGSSECRDGVCSACGGKGQMPGLGALGICGYCGGTGRCPKCEGTGKCTQCRGSGFLTGPNSGSRCGACDGTGLMDIKDFEDPGPNRCPVCLTRLPEGWMFCSFCGHGKACPMCGEPWPKGATACPSCSYQRGGTSR